MPMETHELFLAVIGSNAGVGLMSYMTARHQSEKTARATIEVAKTQAAAAVEAAHAGSAAPIITSLSERLAKLTERVTALETRLETTQHELHIACRYIERQHDACAACQFHKAIPLPTELRAHVDKSVWAPNDTTTT